jgi:hypothetical protein
MSALAGTRLGATGLAVLERHLSRHPRCSACTLADAGLASWRRAVLRSSARDFAGRLHLTGQTGRLIGAGLAVARAPRLASAVWLELVRELRAEDRDAILSHLADRTTAEVARAKALHELACTRLSDRREGQDRRAANQRRQGTERRRPRRGGRRRGPNTERRGEADRRFERDRRSSKERRAATRVD